MATRSLRSCAASARTPCLWLARCSPCLAFRTSPASSPLSASRCSLPTPPTPESAGSQPKSWSTTWPPPR
eukprot:779104-Lingulodinium_polyedra.AAC.1